MSNCKWRFTIDNGYRAYDTDCGNIFYAIDAKPDRFKYCPYCGKEIEVINE